MEQVHETHLTGADSKMGLPSMTSLIRSKSSLKSSQKSVVVRVKQRRVDDEEHDDSCEVLSKEVLSKE